MTKVSIGVFVHNDVNHRPFHSLIFEQYDQVTFIFPILLSSNLLFTCLCKNEADTALKSALDLALVLEMIEGNDVYLQSQFVTAGDRVNTVGHQDGSFPDLGWEMGGIRDHPIKLVDGFRFSSKEKEIKRRMKSPKIRIGKFVLKEALIR